MSVLADWADGMERRAQRIGAAVTDEARWVYAHPSDAARAAGHGIVAGATTVYDLAVGDDVRTLMNPKASTVERVLAGVSLASNFVGPEGRVIDKGITLLVKEVAEHGGERLATLGVEALEKSFGKDAVRLLTEHGAHVAEALDKGLDYAEKALDEINLARGVVDGVRSTIEDTKQTIADVEIALAAAPADRVAAWERVAKDVAMIGKDGLATAGSVKAGVDEFRPPTLASLQHRAESTLLQDAERLKAEGRTYVSGETLLIDVRDSQNFRGRTVAKLETLGAEAQAEGRTLVVFDPNVSREQTDALLAKGIAVAKSVTDLKVLSLASRAPHGIEIVNFAGSVRNNELFGAVQALHQQHQARDTASAVTSDLAGTVHANAKPWDGKSQWEGRVTAIGADGTLEISVGRGAYVTFDAHQARELGIDRAHVAVGNYMDISPREHPQQGLHAEFAPNPAALPARHANQHIGLNQ